LKIEKEEIFYQIMQAGIFIVRQVPYRWMLAIARGVAGLTWYTDKFHRNIAETQMRAALGDRYRPGMSKEVFKFNGDIGVDTIHYAYMSPEEVRERITVNGREHLEAALQSSREQNRGLMVFTSHISNWELIAHLGNLSGVTARVMADQRNQKSVERVITETRVRAGAEPLPPKGGMLKQLIGELKGGRSILILVDGRGNRNNRLVCDLFGLPAQTNPAPAYIALHGDALLLPAWLAKEDGRYSLNFGPHFDSRDSVSGDQLADHYRDADINPPVARLSQRIQDFVSATVPQHPEQWFWLNSRYTRRSNLRRLFRAGGDFEAFLANQKIDLGQLNE